MQYINFERPIGIIVINCNLIAIYIVQSCTTVHVYVKVNTEGTVVCDHLLAAGCREYAGWSEAFESIGSYWLQEKSASRVYQDPYACGELTWWT